MTTTSPRISSPPHSSKVASTPAPVRVKSHGLTDRGKVRASNEDQFLIAELARALWVHQSSVPQPQTRYGGNRGHILLVADGMGGHEAGEVASALTVASIEDFVLHFLKRFTNLELPDEQAVLKDFQSAIQAASARLFEEIAHHREFFGMGTTLTMAFISNWLLFVVHAGDSRCYLYRHGELAQLTVDHTLAADMVRNGILKPEEAAKHKYRHVVTNIIGGTKPNLLADVNCFDLKPDDVLLLCSDGLTEMLTNDDIKTILDELHEPQSACERLIGLANERGGSDNVTAVVARLETAAH